MRSAVIFRKLKSDKSRYKYALLATLVIGAIILAPYLNLQAAYSADDNGFGVPLDNTISTTEGTTLYWTYDSDNTLFDDGFTAYDIGIGINGGSPVMAMGVSITQPQYIVYRIEGSQFSGGDQLIVYIDIHNINGNVYSDEVSIFIFGGQSQTTTTATTHTSGSGGLFGSAGEMFINIIIIFSVALVILVIGVMVYSKR